MKQRYSLFKRNNGIFFIEDHLVRKQESLRTRDKEAALRILTAKNEAYRQPAINLQLAQVYLQHSDPEIGKRTWQAVMDEIVKLKKGNTRIRWEYAIKDKAFDMIRSQVLLRTTAEHFLRALESGTVSTNVHLRKIHNFALGMHWLPWPILPKKQWPAIRFKEKRAITLVEHAKIIERERNPEMKAFYQLLWCLGGSQSDIATLHAEDIDWHDQTIGYSRVKTGSEVMFHFGEQAANVLDMLPRSGFLFPRLALIHERHRAKLFRKRCDTVEISGVSLHSYRYAWAERAKQAGYPERFAQEALGHNSKAVHRAYAKKAKVKLPSLEDYEIQAAGRFIQT